MGSATTNSHGVPAFDFATVSGYDQLVVGPTHARGRTLSLDLLMTDVPDPVRVAVVAPIGNLDHSTLSTAISIAQAVPNLCVSRKVFPKHQVNWNTVCGAIQDLRWYNNIWLTDNPVEVLNEHLYLLVGRYVHTMVIRVRNRDKPWFNDQCRRVFDLKQGVHLWWTRDRSRVNWEDFVHSQVRANETYSEVERHFRGGSRDVLMNVQSPHKWWSTLKSAVVGSSSSLPPLVSEGGGRNPGNLLIWSSLAIRHSVLPPLPFRPSEVRRLLLDSDPYGGTDPVGTFPFILKRTADVMAVSV